MTDEETRSELEELAEALMPAPTPPGGWVLQLERLRGGFAALTTRGVPCPRCGSQPGQRCTVVARQPGAKRTDPRIRREVSRIHAVRRAK